MGRHVSASDAHTAVLVMSSEILDKPIDTDSALLELARARHAKLSERWQIGKHEETIVRHAGTAARATRWKPYRSKTSRRKDASKANEQRSSMFVVGISCVHPTDSTMLVEVGISERGQVAKMHPAIARDAEQAIASLTFHRFNEQALQKSAEAARTTGLADAEAVLKPYVDADAAWARYFLAQIIERARPVPENAVFASSRCSSRPRRKGWPTPNGRSARSTCAAPLAYRRTRRLRRRCCGVPLNAVMQEQLSNSALPNCRAPRALRPTRAKARCGCNAPQRGLKEAQELLKGTRDQPAKNQARLGRPGCLHRARRGFEVSAQAREKDRRDRQHSEHNEAERQQIARPTINSIVKNCPASGAAPQRQACFGSKKPSSAASRQTAGMPIEKYNSESHASFLPEAVEISIHISAPPAPAAINNQCSFFMSGTLTERVTPTP